MRSASETRPGASNEHESAAWAARAMNAAGAAPRDVEAVHELIMATRHDGVATDADSRLLLDIDLAIHGSPPERFARYDADVRSEYRWVPGPLCRRKRREVLQTFLERSPLYATAPARELLEAQAHENLQAAVAVA